MAERTPDIINIKPKGRTRSDFLVLEFEYEDGKKAEKAMLGTRFGISWPSNENPGGYYINVAQEATRSILGISPLWVVGELTGVTFESLITKMFNEMGLYGSKEIFGDISEHNRSFVMALETQRRKSRDLQEIRLKEAPYFDQFIKGSNTITKWIKVIKGLTIPRKFCIHTQLREMREEDLGPKVDEIFFAVNALRYVLEAFETSRIPESTKNRAVQRGVSPGAWT